jgi:hypothetical protein
MSTQTPQTDAFYANRFKAPDAIDFARTLEADRDRLKALCEELREALTWLVTYEESGIRGPSDITKAARAALKKAEKP